MVDKSVCEIIQLHVSFPRQNILNMILIFQTIIFQHYSSAFSLEVGSDSLGSTLPNGTSLNSVPSLRGKVNYIYKQQIV